MQFFLFHVLDENFVDSLECHRLVNKDFRNLIGGNEDILVTQHQQCPDGGPMH